MTLNQNMKKLLLLLVLSLGFIGSTNASDKTFTCESIDKSVYYHPSQQKYYPLEDWKLIFTLANNLIHIKGPSTEAFAGDYYVVNDFIHNNNFNATAKSEVYQFSNLSFENGYLILSWMNRGSASIGVLVANCSITDTLHYQ